MGVICIILSIYIPLYIGVCKVYMNTLPKRHALSNERYHMTLYTYSMLIRG